MFGGVLSNLATSLEGTIVDEQPTPFVDRPTPFVDPPAAPAEDNSLRSQIIKNAIAKGQEAEMKKTHPLSGGLFDHLSNFQSTMGSETQTTTTEKPFMAPYVMVQKANNTQELLEMNKNATKNVTKVVATNMSKDSNVQVIANKTTEIAKNIHSASDKNNTVITNKTALPQPIAQNKPVKSAVKVDTNMTAKPV